MSMLKILTKIVVGFKKEDWVNITVMLVHEGGQYMA